MVRVYAAASGSNPILTSRQDLFPVVLDSTLSRYVNSQLVATCLLEFLIMFLLSLNCFFHVKVEWLLTNLIAKGISTRAVFK